MRVCVRNSLQQRLSVNHHEKMSGRFLSKSLPEWFENQNFRRQILWNDLNNRMDICLLCPETDVSIDFVFEPGYPVPEVPDEFWF